MKANGLFSCKDQSSPFKSVNLPILKLFYNFSSIASAIYGKNGMLNAYVSDNVKNKNGIGLGCTT